MKRLEKYTIKAYKEMRAAEKRHKQLMQEAKRKLERGAKLTNHEIEL